MHHAHRFVPPAVYVLVPTILLLPILLQDKMLLGFDVASVFHFQRIVIAQAFREGRLPVWDPHVMAGFPLLAGVQGAVFYPPTWLCLVQSAAMFWTLSAWAHLILAGLFAHRWLERGLGVGTRAALAGGLVYMLSGYVVGHLYAGHVNYVWAYPWMAALLWRLERFLAGPTVKRGALLAVVLAMLFLAGVPQFVSFAAMIVLARAVHFVLAPRGQEKARAKIVGQAAAWLFLGLMLCAPQLLPTLELLGQMHRAAGADPAFLRQYSMPPFALKSVFIPPTIDHDSCEWTPYIGVGSLLLAAAAHSGRHPQRHLLTGVAVVSLLLAMGTHFPLYKGFAAVVPGAGFFRGPGRYLLLFTVAAAGLVGLGFDALWNRLRLPFRASAAILAAAAILELAVWGKEYFQPYPKDGDRFPPGVEQVLRERCGLEGRVAPDRTRVMTIGICQAQGVDIVGGYEPMMLRRFAELMNAARGAPPEKSVVIVTSVSPHPVARMLSVRAWVSGGWKISDERDPLPRAWIVNHAVVLEPKEERLKVLSKGPWDPGKTVILEQVPKEALPVTTEGAAGRAKVVSRRPGEYVLEAENDADAYLVLSEAYYPGWSAEVDGKAVEVVPANHLIQAIRLPPGKHGVRFAYRSRFLGAGFAIAALAAIGPAAFVLIRRRRR